MDILVTGGAGFIGSHLVRWLVEQGHSVRVLDNLTTGHAHNLEPVASAIDMRTADLQDADAVREALVGVDYVFHLAALISVVQSVEQPLLTHAINVNGTLGLLEAARAAGVRRLVQVSSAAIYGDPAQVPTPEATPPEPLSPYGLTKHIAEEYGQLYSRLYGLECVALRFFNVYGPRQDPHSPYAAAVPRFVDALASGKQPTVFGDGLQTRDFTFVEDNVRALWVAASAPGIAGAVFNVGRGQPCTVLDLINTLADLLGVEARPHFVPARAGEIRHSCAAVEAFAQQAGFRAQVSLSEGLGKTLESWPGIL
ncbi:MAG: NAD-dependent epimerase/dehydratase family protein [Chloroflexales bacterium]|nr:NAD-dependent epimerase/dehydratase family protein [Chloroflexales bacterium]